MMTTIIDEIERRLQAAEDGFGFDEELLLAVWILIRQPVLDVKYERERGALRNCDYDISECPYDESAGNEYGEVVVELFGQRFSHRMIDGSLPDTWFARRWHGPNGEVCDSLESILNVKVNYEDYLDKALMDDEEYFGDEEEFDDEDGYDDEDVREEEIEMPPRASADRLSACARAVMGDAGRHGRPSVLCASVVTRMVRDPGLEELDRCLRGSKSDRPPDLNSPVLSFSARLLTLVKERCGGRAAVAYRRAGLSRQWYSNVISHDDSRADKTKVMQMCIGLQLSKEEADRLMAAAGYAFACSRPVDRLFVYCIENSIWNINDIQDTLADCGLPMLDIA